MAPFNSGIIVIANQTTLGAGLVPAPDGATTRVAPTEHEENAGIPFIFDEEGIKFHFCGFHS